MNDATLDSFDGVDLTCADLRFEIGILIALSATLCCVQCAGRPARNAREATVMPTPRALPTLNALHELCVESQSESESMDSTSLAFEVP